MRAVLDTNVLASGFLGFADAIRPPSQLLRLWQEGRFALVVSDHILSELLDTLADPFFQQRLGPDQIAEATRLLQEEAEVAPAGIRVSGVATHPEDDLVLSAAIAANADFLVTGDKGLRALYVIETVRILTPREFLNHLTIPGDAAR